jgi:hypothetical protein
LKLLGDSLSSKNTPKLKLRPTLVSTRSLAYHQGFTQFESSQIRQDGSALLKVSPIWSLHHTKKRAGDTHSVKKLNSLSSAVSSSPFINAAASLAATGKRLKNYPQK